MNEMTAEDWLAYAMDKGAKTVETISKQRLAALITAVKGSPYLAIYIANKVIALGEEKK
ncbi:hypothetical protein ES703_30825 [subsurface metagenome]